jgi:hypothetical protein
VGGQEGQANGRASEWNRNGKVSGQIGGVSEQEGKQAEWDGQ